MASTKQIVEMARIHGFTQYDEPGFLGFQRTHPDGRAQQLHIFGWSNKKRAAQRGTPSAYLVICPAIAVPLHDRQSHWEDGRFTVLLVQWPEAPDRRRPWSEVVEEFDDVFAPMFALPEDQGRLWLADVLTTHGL